MFKFKPSTAKHEYQIGRAYEVLQDGASLGIVYRDTCGWSTPATPFSYESRNEAAQAVAAKAAKPANPNRLFRPSPNSPAVELMPPTSSIRTCNVCCERPATREVSFGSCQVRLAFCEPCAGASSQALVAAQPEVA